MCKIFFIEGPDYSGKTTLINKIKKSLKDKRILTLKEPGYEMREMLLDKDRNLNSYTRRLLFTASHIEVMTEIYRKKDDYDIILVDRTAIVSDLIYSSNEDDVSDTVANATRKLFVKLIEIYKKTDEMLFGNFFKNNSNLILVHVDEETFKARLSSRVVDEQDIHDSKDDKFKWKIRHEYEHFLEEESLVNLIIPNIFKKAYTIKSSNGGLAFYQFLDILHGGNNNV